MAATQTTETEVNIPQITLGRVLVVIEGTSPLLTNKFGERALEGMAAKQGKAAKVEKPPRDPDADFRDALHIIDADAHIYGFPAAGLKKALVAAGGRFAAEKMTVLRGVLSIEGSMLEIKAPEPHMRTDPVRLQGSTFSIAYRPEFWPWRIEVPVVYNAGMLTLDQVLNLFNIAGFAVGIGAWRPESNGTFGQFSIAEARGGAQD